MTKIAFIFLFLFVFINIQAQSCKEIMDIVKSEGYGISYFSPSSEAITQVTFYEINDSDYNTYYFAIVQFTSSYQKYIYQVGPSTKFNYSMEYLSSAGKAFWKYIQPYSDVLGCSPNFE